MTPRSTPRRREAALAIDASTYRATVALLEGEQVLASDAVPMRGVHEERLMPAIADVLGRGAVSAGELTRVICGGGPGSFTSLRIAAAIGKGLTTAAARRQSRAVGSPAPAVGDEAPRLATVSSLVLILAGIADRAAPGRYVAALDALRGERYGMMLTLTRAEGTAPHGRPRIAGTGAWRRLVAADLTRWADEAGATIVGPGYADDAWPAAEGARWVPEWIHDVDPVGWEPEYGRLAEAQVRLAARSAARDEPDGA